MDRIKGILAASTLTGIILITVLVLGFGNIRALNQSALPPTVMINPSALNDGAANTAVAQTSPQDVQDLQAYAQQLEGALQVMQNREAAYQAQINTANQTVLQLQDQINNQNAAQPQVVSNAQHEGTTFHFDDEGGFDRD
ncbi:MAG: hypothetical protein KC441_02755 [Anaerolineales bacterium]|nr:hypothetical protein [Anaerolineales bacterium]